MSSLAARSRSGDSRPGLYQEITDKIIAELEAGRVPWVQPWRTAAAGAPLSMPNNASTNRCYSGINVLILWGAVIERGFTGQRWVKFRQAVALGGNVRKGERGTTVVYAEASFPEMSAAARWKPATMPEASRSSSASRSLTPTNVTVCCEGRAAATIRDDRAGSQGADRGDRRGFPHRRSTRLL